jgi:hypothetical protein
VSHIADWRVHDDMRSARLELTLRSNCCVSTVITSLSSKREYNLGLNADSSRVEGTQASYHLSSIRHFPTQRYPCFVAAAEFRDKCREPRGGSPLPITYKLLYYGVSLYITTGRIVTLCSYICLKYTLKSIYIIYR